jgi:hypothetical protein
MTVDEKFSLCDLDHRPYAVLNHSVIEDLEWLEITYWCEQNNCKYRGIGVIEFPTSEAMTLFVMRWA